MNQNALEEMTKNIMIDLNLRRSWRRREASAARALFISTLFFLVTTAQLLYLYHLFPIKLRIMDFQIFSIVKKLFLCQRERRKIKLNIVGSIQFQEWTQLACSFKKLLQEQKLPYIVIKTQKLPCSVKNSSFISLNNWQSSSGLQQMQML